MFQLTKSEKAGVVANCDHLKRRMVRKLVALEKKYDAQFKVVFDAIRQLLIPPEKPKSQIGFCGTKIGKW